MPSTASHRPHARRKGCVARPLDGDLLVLAPGHNLQRLDPVAAYVWQHADGERSPQNLCDGIRQQRPDADIDMVFEALDRLADADLLQARIAPPAGLSRRVMVQRLVGAAALAALTSVVSPGRALAAKGGACGDDKELIAEIAWLEAEQAAIGDLLEEWADEAEKTADDAAIEDKAADDAAAADTAAADTADDKPDAADELYIAELRAREQSRKKNAAAYEEKRKHAEGDLAECKLAKKKQQIGAKEQHRKQHFDQRQEHLVKRLEHSKERHHKRNIKLETREQSRKSKLHTQEAKTKKKAQTEEQAQKSVAKRTERQVKTLQRLKLRKLHASEAAQKRDHRIDEHLVSNELRREQRLKHLDHRLVSSEEKAKVQAESYSATQAEETAKAAGVDDNVLATAQEEAMAAAIAAEEKAKQFEKAAEEKQKASTAEDKSKGF